MTDNTHQYPVPMTDELRALLGDEYNRVEKAIREAQVNMILGRTPEYAREERLGRGGKYYPYVKHSWVEMQLNLIFGWRWSFEVLREQVGKNNVWVYGQLTAYMGNLPITKSAYGGSEIARHSKNITDRETGEIKVKAGDIISIRDDLEKAKSLALTKCARLFGISADVGAKREEIEAIFDEEAQAEITKEVFQ